tara:strand:- start:84 stop:353 length:270 start_codon:yes stop_codon:yes gene_type:complete
MLKEIKYAIYILTIFFSLFLIINFYLSDNNIKNNKKIILQYQNEKGESFKNLPVIENDTNNIIEYTNEIEKFKNKKKRKFWDLLKTNEE